MGTPVGYRLRRSRISAHRLGPAFLIMAIYIALMALVNLPSRSSTGPVGIVIALSWVALTAAAVWPVRVLDVTPQALWVRERLVPVESRFGGTSGRLRKIDWPDVRRSGGVLADGPHGLALRLPGVRVPGEGRGAIVGDEP